MQDMPIETNTADEPGKVGPVLGAAIYAWFVLVLLGFLPIMAASSARHRGDPTQRIPGRWMRRLGRFLPSTSPLWRFSIEGAPPPDICNSAYVVVANHESTADPFLLSFLPWDMRWVAKEELFHLPLVGWLLRFSGDIRLRRGSGESVRHMKEACLDTLAHGLPVMMFPEGTRSRDGSLLPFKDGAFEIAVEAGVPVLPVALVGTRACRQPDSIWFGRARAVARILDPIDTTGRTTAEVRDEAREAIAAALRSLRRRVNPPPAMSPRWQESSPGSSRQADHALPPSSPSRRQHID